MSIMNDREERIVEAAVRLFSRYGVKRTSMNDIAVEAGIARQTLYNAFANKDEVLRATIRLFTDRATDAIAKGLAHRTKLGDRLDLVFEHIAVRPFELLHASPNTEDIIAGFDAASREEIALSNEQLRAVIEGLLEPYRAEIADAGQTTRAFSDFIRQAASAAKHNASDRAHLDALLGSLKAASVAVADGN